MALWFVRGLRRGVVTTRYPKGSDRSATLLPSPPAFRPGALTGPVADRLAASCPTGALRRQDSVLVYDLGRCCTCGACGAVGADVIVGSGEFELAATNRDALVKRIPIHESPR